MHYLIRGCKAIYQHANQSDLRVEGNRITEIGQQLSPGDAVIVDARDCVLYPGMVNTHHHLAQSLFKAVPEGLNHGLGDWLASVPYRFWPYMTADDVYLAARLGLAELIRSGATSCADHHYLYHSTGSSELEAALWQAAEDSGIRFTLCRGGATVKGTHKGLAQAGIEPETLEQALAGLDASRRRYHQPGADAMRRLVVAPTSLIHSSTAEDLRELAAYARNSSLRMHSHLLEVAFDEQQARQRHGCSAVEYAESVDWLGNDVWFAHLVQATPADIQRLAGSGTGIAHCPTSNGRLGSGIAPVMAMQEAGMTVSLGVDGAASSESGSMIQEANLSWLMQRAAGRSLSPTLDDAMHWATAAGADILGLPECGRIEVGMLADLVLYDTSAARYQGMMADVWAPLLGAEPVTLKASFINGKAVLQDGVINGLDEEKLAADLQQARLQLVARANA